MTIRQILEKLAVEKNNPCVSISLKTHRTHPDNVQDAIVLKKLLKEAEERVINEFGKRPAAAVLEKLAEIESDIDINYNLDSLHIFVSSDTKEIVKSALPMNDGNVQISDSFAIRPLIKASNRSEEYFTLLLSQSGVHLYRTLNDGILGEVRNDDFPFSENSHYNTASDKASDSKLHDDLVREFLNKVDKALVKVHNETGMNCVVISTEDNYSRLMQVADKPGIYLGYAAISYNNTAHHHIAKQTWEIVSELKHQQRAQAISDMKEAVAQGKVLTDLQEIYQAAIDGRAEQLLIHQSFVQPVIMTSDRTFDRITDVTIPHAIDDITSNIAWDVISKKGKVIFTLQDELKDLGDIVLKVRY